MTINRHGSYCASLFDNSIKVMNNASDEKIEQYLETIFGQGNVTRCYTKTYTKGPLEGSSRKIIEVYYLRQMQAVEDGVRQWDDFDSYNATAFESGWTWEKAIRDLMNSTNRIPVTSYLS